MLHSGWWETEDSIITWRTLLIYACFTDVNGKIHEDHQMMHEASCSPGLLQIRTMHVHDMCFDLKVILNECTHMCNEWIRTTSVRALCSSEYKTDFIQTGASPAGCACTPLSFSLRFSLNPSILPVMGTCPPRLCPRVSQTKRRAQRRDMNHHFDPRAATMHRHFLSVHGGCAWLVQRTHTYTHKWSLFI